MQKSIDTNVHLQQTVSPFESIGKSDAINRMKTASDFDNPSQKVEKLRGL